MGAITLLLYPIALAILIGCGAPQTFSVNLEKRQKSQGIDLAGKSISVVCTGSTPEEQAVALSVGENFSVLTCSFSERRASALPRLMQ